MSSPLRSLPILCAFLGLAEIAFAQGHPRAGFRADLQTIIHGVSGSVSIVDADTLLIEDFSYDGQAAQAFFRLGIDESETSFASGLQIPPQIPNVPIVNATFMLQLPPGATVDPYGAVSVWCVPFGLSMGKGAFLSPALPNSIRPAALTSDPTLVDLGGDPTRGPLLNNSVELFQVGLDCSQAGRNGLYAMRVHAGQLAAPAATRFGSLWITGPVLGTSSGFHSQNQVLFAAGGVILPNDPALVGATFTAQGACGGQVVRLSNGLVQTIGG